jgi:tRNA G10  N-methylase Trm11
MIHYIYFGECTAIGPAGTKGSPSQTLRRTHRGILKDYALKNRIDVGSNTSDFARSNISTAMEPELGFLMANLALASKSATSKPVSVLDPCCGSGSLLLYAAALGGATTLFGVDSVSGVWCGADAEFKRHHLAIPTFAEGDVFNPSAIRELSTPNFFDAIICDPPYNIGAPVFIDKQDARPANRHRKGYLVRGEEIVFCEDISAAVLILAGQLLVDGGRVVLFIPEKDTNRASVIERYKTTMQSASLNPLFERRQKFSPTFSRWLVCLEKRVACSA